MGDLPQRASTLPESPVALGGVQGIGAADGVMRRRQP